MGVPEFVIPFDIDNYWESEDALLRCARYNLRKLLAPRPDPTAESLRVQTIDPHEEMTKDSDESEDSIESDVDV